MSSFTDIFLLERAPLETAKCAAIIVDSLVSEVPVEEMRNKRGADFDSTAFYQIRVKPKMKDLALDDVLNRIERWAKSPVAKKFGITQAQINERARNSGKFSSVTFNYQGMDYEIVVAQGGNKGENFEKDLLLKMDNLVAGVEDSDQAKDALAALEGIDPVFKLSNISSISPRSGSTQRSGDMTPEETGAIIADIVITLKNGEKKYISLKNEMGSTVAQFGISKAFNEDLTVNTESKEWKTWLEPFGLDPELITEGLLAAQNQTDISFDDVVTMEKKVTSKSAIFKIMQKMWGANYYYLREKRDGFTALKIDRDYVDNDLLKNLVVTQVRYPCISRKQITIYLTSDAMRFKVEVRNPRGKGIVRPTQIQLTVMKSAK